MQTFSLVNPNHHKGVKNNANKPQVIIVHTTKGKGIKAFENDPVWHARKIKGEELEIGKKELGIV